MLMPTPFHILWLYRNPEKCIKSLDLGLEQLVSCCLEDIIMDKLHNMMIDLDICSTLHMDISLDDLD